MLYGAESLFVLRKYKTP